MLSRQALARLCWESMRSCWDFFSPFSYPRPGCSTLADFALVLKHLLPYLPVRLGECIQNSEDCTIKYKYLYNNPFLFCSLSVGSKSGDRSFIAELVQWLCLPDAFFPPRATILIGKLALIFISVSGSHSDFLSGYFFQLLFACCQWRVFNLELLYANE